ncbi:hypothetical protein ACFZAU_18190 [Streptomyces sp. NPDC008238]
MLRRCAPALAALLLVSGCGGGSAPVRTAAAGSPSAVASATAVDSSPPVPESSPPSPAAAEPSGTVATVDATPAATPSDDGDPPGGVTGTPASGGGPRTTSCGALPGSGTFTDPLQLGVADGPVVAEGCAPLTAGAPFNVRYFSFTLPGAPAPDAHAGPSFTITPDALGPVYPAVVLPGGWVLKNSLGSGYWTGTEPWFTGRYQPISDLAPGTYILRTEKLDLPLHSLTTPAYDVLVDPGTTA